MFLLVGSTTVLPDLARTAHRLYETLSLLHAAVRSEDGYVLPAAFLDATPGRPVGYLHSISSSVQRSDISDALQCAIAQRQEQQQQQQQGSSSYYHSTPDEPKNHNINASMVGGGCCPLRAIGAAFLLATSFQRRFFETSSSWPPLHSTTTTSALSTPQQPLVVVVADLLSLSSRCCGSTTTSTTSSSTTMRPSVVGDVVFSAALLELVKHNARLGILHHHHHHHDETTTTERAVLSEGKSRKEDDGAGWMPLLLSRRLAMMAHSTAQGFVHDVRCGSEDSAGGGLEAKWGDLVLACLGQQPLLQQGSRSTVGILSGASLEERQKWAMLQYTPKPMANFFLTVPAASSSSSSSSLAVRTQQIEIGALCSRCMMIVPLPESATNAAQQQPSEGRCPYCTVEQQLIVAQHHPRQQKMSSDDRKVRKRPRQ